MQKQHSYETIHTYKLSLKLMDRPSLWLYQLIYCCFFFLFSLPEAYFLDDMILLKFGERISQKNNTNLLIHINLNLKLNQFLYGCTLILIEHEQRISDYALCFKAITVRTLLQSVKLNQYKYIITFNSRA